MLYPPEKSGIKSWAEADRPREKLLLKGKHILSDSELLAIIIGSGNKNQTAVELSKAILSAYENDLGGLARMSVPELMKFRGIGEAKAIGIVAALELGRRRRENEGMNKEKIHSSNDAFEILQPLLSDLKHEEFWVLLLNRANKIIKKQQISMGGIAGTVVDPKIIFKFALDYMASSIILCHNHPSGNHQPSEADIRLTKKIRDAGNFLDITVLDHLIIADQIFYSFADEGKL